MSNSYVPPHRVDAISWRRLIEAAQQGDAHAEHQLMRRFDRLVCLTVWKLRLPPQCDRDDLAQEGRLGLAVAIRAWRPERGAFPAFAKLCIRNHVLSAVNAACTHKQQVLALAARLEGTRRGGMANGDRPTIRLLEKLADRDPSTDPERRLLAREHLASVVRAFPTLTDSERTVLAGTLRGESYAESAAALGRTTKATRRVAERAREKLAAALLDAA